MRNHFGETGDNLPGDVDRDGSVGLNDLNFVRNNFGVSAPVSSAASSTRRAPQAVSTRTQYLEVANKDAARAADAVFGHFYDQPLERLADGASPGEIYLGVRARHRARR